MVNNQVHSFFYSAISDSMRKRCGCLYGLVFMSGECGNPKVDPLIVQACGMNLGLEVYLWGALALG